MNSGFNEHEQQFSMSVTSNSEVSAVVLSKSI